MASSHQGPPLASACRLLVVGDGQAELWVCPVYKCNELYLCVLWFGSSAGRGDEPRRFFSLHQRRPPAVCQFSLTHHSLHFLSPSKRRRSAGWFVAIYMRLCEPWLGFVRSLYSSLFLWHLALLMVGESVVPGRLQFVVCYIVASMMLQARSVSLSQLPGGVCLYELLSVCLEGIPVSPVQVESGVR